MLIDRLVRFLLPKQEHFFELLDQLGSKLEAAGAKFGDFATARTREDFQAIAKSVKSIEHDADQIAHQIFEALDKTFVTPIDREDLAALTTAVDDVVDHIDHCAGSIVHYRIEELTPHMRELLRIQGLAVVKVVGAINTLRHFGQPEKLQPFLVEVNSLENEADGVYSKALEHLFDAELPAKDLIRQKDVVQVLEDSIDACEDVLDVIRSVAVKNG